MTITILAQGKQLSSFPLLVNVLPTAQGWSEDSKDYFNITGFLPAPGDARPGQYLKVSGVDSTGRVTGVCAADVSFVGGSGQSDWNAAEGDPGHIRNRPFYADPILHTVLAQTQPVYNDQDGMFYVAEAFSLVPGEEYMVHWNGADYRCTAMEIAINSFFSAVCVGDIGALNGVPVTGEPFGIACLSPEMADLQGGAYGMVVPMDGCTELTLSISGITETIVPIPKKYLTEARCQKKIILDMDVGTASINVPSPDEIETGELQAAITVIYNGREHSCLIASRDSITEGDLTFHFIEFLFSEWQENGGDGINLVRGTWAFNQVTFQEARQTLRPYDGPRTCISFYVQPTNGTHCWMDTHNLLLDGILLESPSRKKFFLTVKDDGTLSTSENY